MQACAVKPLFDTELQGTNIKDSYQLGSGLPRNAPWSSANDTTYTEPM